MSGPAGGANVLATLRQKMQTLRDELDATKDTLDERNRLLEAEKTHRDDVCDISNTLLVYWLQSFKLSMNYGCDIKPFRY